LPSCLGELRLVFLFLRGLFDFLLGEKLNSEFKFNYLFVLETSEAMPRPDDLGWEQVDPEGVRRSSVSRPLHTDYSLAAAPEEKEALSTASPRRGDADERASDSGPKRALAGTTGHASTLQRRKCKILLRWTRLVRSSRLAQRLAEIGKLVLNPHIRPKERK
jgi:hypothetical protein